MTNQKEENPGEIKEPIAQPSAEIDGHHDTIDCHIKAAAHSMEAAKHNLDAARYHEEGKHDKAAESTVLAYGHHAIAGDYLSDNAKHHAQKLKETKYE
jgi:hypothetical protein